MSSSQIAPPPSVPPGRAADDRGTDHLDRDDLDADGLDDEGFDDELIGLPKDRPGAASRALAVWLVVAGAVGGLAAFTLSWDKVKLLENPNAHFLCSINVFVSCGSVMKTPQASEFGFPNSFLGVAGFAIVLAIGMGLLAGAAFHRWFWLGLQVGVIGGIALICWLIDQSLYHIGALCPYCMVVWTVMIPTFFAVTAYNLRSGNLGPAGVRPGRALTRHLGPVLVVAYALVLALIGHRFGFEPSRYLPS